MSGELEPVTSARIGKSLLAAREKSAQRSRPFGIRGFERKGTDAAVAHAVMTWALLPPIPRKNGPQKTHRDVLRHRVKRTELRLTT